MSLPLIAVDRLFDRLTATYGNDFMRRYEGFDMNTVKSSWGHELSWFTDKLGMIAWALENLPPRAPNVIEFRAICRQAPAPETPRIEHQPADPKRVADELTKLGGMKQKFSVNGNVDHRAWAKRILQRQKDGDRRLTLTQLAMARGAFRE